MNVQWLKKAPGEDAFVEVDGVTSAMLEVKNASADMDGTVFQARVSTSDCMPNFLKKSHSASSRLQPLPVLALVSVAVARMVPLPTWQVTTLQVLMPRPTGTT